MGTPNKQNNLLVRTPKYSIFDYSNDSKLTMPIGRIVPANHGYELYPGEELDVNLQELVRFMPLQAPVMQRYILDFIPCFIPFRLLWNEDYPIWNANKFFNPVTPDSERPAIPMTSWKQIFTNKSGKIFGSVFDYLGYPTMTGLYTAMTSCGLYVAGSTQIDSTIDALFDWSNKSYTASMTFQYLGSQYTISLGQSGSDYDTFWLYIAHKYSLNFSDYETEEEFLKVIPGKHTKSGLTDEYLNSLFSNCVLSKVFASATSKDLSLLPWLCYHKAISDWFIRTDMIDPDTYMSNVKLVNDSLVTGVQNLSQLQVSSSFVPYLLSGLPAPRLWMDDYFTTALTTATNTASQVALPVSGSIQDFWQKNRLAEFKTRMMLAGKRYIDQIRALWGVTVPDARLQRTEILGHVKFNLIVSDVLQTSQSDIDSSLGQFAGSAVSSNGNHLFHYKADEPGMVLILCSVRPNTAYVDQVPRLILRKDYNDFENPTYDNVGTQPILNNELFYRPGDTSVFGFSPRRYAEYMTNFSEIHGDFKTSLDYWHAGRKFDLSGSVPALNNSFISMEDSDAFDRIFASQSLTDNIVCQFYFDAKVTRPLSRFVNYHM